MKQVAVNIYCLHQCCINSVKNFVEALMFSVEVQTTIGYGRRFVENNCEWTQLVYILQILVGTFVKSMMEGITFVKLSQSNKRQKSIKFSDKALVCFRNEIPHLIFRVIDSRRTLLVDCRINVKVVHKKVVKVDMNKNNSRAAAAAVSKSEPPLEFGSDTCISGTGTTVNGRTNSMKTRYPDAQMPEEDWQSVDYKEFYQTQCKTGDHPGDSKRKICQKWRVLHVIHVIL